jgi:SAM-dependent methyltransferase
MQETVTPADALAARLVQAVLGAMDVQSVYLGDKLGYYRALADAGAMTAAELAGATGAGERYTREWLEQQAVTGLLAVDDASADAAARRYSFPSGHREVLADVDGPAYVAGLARVVAAAGSRLADVAEAARAGTGVPWSAYGPDMMLAQADANRGMFLSSLGPDVLARIPGVHERLSGPDARVADVGCGCGWSSIAIARAYPSALVDGYDLDEPSIAVASENARALGLEDRVRFHVRDVAGPSLAGSYDLVAAFECVHDVAQPVPFLASMGRLAKDDGVVLVMDERVGESFSAPGGDVERAMYGYSITVCLPDSLSSRPTAASGTVMRPATLRGYAREAGFADVEVLPIDNDFFRFYRLVR